MTGDEPVDDGVVGTLVGGRYRIVRRLAEGGMGIVYEAEHEELGGRLAVKIIRPEACFDPAGVERFLHEARIASRLGHPHLVDVFDLGRLDDGRPFMAMKLLRGRDLEEILREDGAQEPARVVELLTGPAAALDAIHAMGLVHRDVKLENIYVEQLDGGGENVRLMDFGLAALQNVGSRLTRKGQVLGTPHYLAPELCTGEKAGSSADVYGLAVVAYELIADALPFDQDDPAEVLAAKMSMDAPALSTRTSHEIPADLDDLFDRSLSRDPRRRPKSCGDLIKRLDAIVSTMATRRTPRVVSSRKRTSPGLGPESIPPPDLSTPEPADEPPKSAAQPTEPTAETVSAARTERDRTATRVDPLPFAKADSELAKRGHPTPVLKRVPDPLDTADPPRVPSSSRAPLALLFVALLIAIAMTIAFSGEDASPITTQTTESDADAHARAAEVAQVETSVTMEPESEVRAEPEPVSHARMSVREHVPAPESVLSMVEEVHSAPVEAPPEPEPRLEVARVEADRERARSLTAEADRLSLRGLLPLAIDKYRDATMADHEYAPAWRGLGIANQHLRRRPEAQQAYRRYLQIAPNAPDAPRIRARVASL